MQRFGYSLDLAQSRKRDLLSSKNLKKNFKDTGLKIKYASCFRIGV